MDRGIMEHRHALAVTTPLVLLVGCSSISAPSDAGPRAGEVDATNVEAMELIADAPSWPIADTTHAADAVVPDAVARAETVDQFSTETVDASAPETGDQALADLRMSDTAAAVADLRLADTATEDFATVVLDLATEMDGPDNATTPDLAREIPPADDAPAADAVDAAQPDLATIDACLPESDTEFCERLDKACDAFSGTDNCGASRTVMCGSCAGARICLQNQCVCSPETDAVLCAKVAGRCGRVTTTDRCGRSRTIDCAGCAAGRVCASNLCCTPETDEVFCARTDVQCGRASGTDNCGGARTVTDCCDDRNACTNDVCGNGICRHVNVHACGQACSNGAGCAITDTDGDGLNDVWETNGYIDLDCNGRYDEGTDTPLPDADVGRPNVYVKWDYMASAAGFVHTHRPLDSSMDYARTTFALHNAVLSFFPEHDEIAEKQVVALSPAASMDPNCVGPDAISLYTLKRDHFPAFLAPAYHYAVFAHFAGCDSALHCAACPSSPKGGQPQFGANGLAELPGNDFVVSLGSSIDMGLYPVPETLEIGSFMHELGHNFGLRHGGGDDLSGKPNYLSVMNYTYASGIGTTTDPGPWDTAESIVPDGFRIDYSDRLTGALHEGSLAGGVCVNDGSAGLSETAGVTGNDPLDTDIVSFFSNDYLLFGPSNGSPIDWNYDGSISTEPVFLDVNGDGLCSTLEGFNDWEHTHPSTGVTRLSHIVTSPACNAGNWAD